MGCCLDSKNGNIVRFSKRWTTKMTGTIDRKAVAEFNNRQRQRLVGKRRIYKNPAQ